ncbi:chromosomal protein MC1a [Paramecium bursaria Chlorella virus MA1E]|nr:chromosomal protein MC1a [Paramecium bursaria Chlorella virus MA1E]
MIAGKPVKIEKESKAKFVKVVHTDKKGKGSPKE